MALVRCQLPDSQYLTTLKTTVVSCVPYVEAAPAASKDEKDSKSKGKDKSKAKDEKSTAAAAAAGDEKSAAAAPAAAPVQLYDVVLADTVLFPIGGGQPCDYGTINDAKVVNVQRNAAADGVVVHRTSAKFEVNASVDVSVDWARRYDHMQCHTGQHLISAVAVKEFKWKTLSWCLTDAPRECYIEFDTPDITDEHWAAFEAAVNTAIRAALPLKVHVFNSLEEAKNNELVLRSKGIPADLKGPLRLIEIANTDFNTCCGTHLRTTAEIQSVSFVRKEKARKHTIVYFLAGNRLLDAMTRMVTTQRKLATLLSCGPELHVQTVTNTQASLKAANKSRDKLIKEVAAAQAPGLVRAAVAAGRLVASVYRDDDCGATFVSAIVDAVATAATEQKVPNFTLFVSDAETGMYVVSGAGAVKHGPEISKLLGGRGGGKGKYQGKTTTLPLTAELHQKAVDYLVAQADLKAP